MSQTIALLVGLVLGIFFSRSLTQEQPTTKEALVALSNTDKADLSSLEKTLSSEGDSQSVLLAMLACIQARKSNINDITQVEQTSIADKSTVNAPTFPKPDPTTKINSELSPSHAPETLPTRSDESSATNASTKETSRPAHYYRDTYPPARIRIPRSERAGFIDEENVDITSFLESRKCDNPATATLSEKLMGESLFFQAVRSHKFNLTLRTNKGAPYKGSINFQLDDAKFKDQIRFFSTGSDNPLEDRTLTYPSTHGAWRLNSCKPGIILLGTHCPWAKEKNYTQEFKDLYYLAHTHQLIGNVYCKKTSDTKWTWIGTLEPNLN